ncbi:MAG: DUF4339 domain-containing protein [Verrucomicrobiota bacterium]|jgi:hypothetical protein|nr:DUF4339 domain-containing protein [Verrucomicrobiota bacterium]
MQVHLERSGQRYGPYSIEEINTYLKSGQVLISDIAWYEGAPDWMPLTEVPGVQVGEPTPAPPPPTPGIEGEKEEGAPTISAEALAAAAKMDELPEDLKERQIAIDGDSCLFMGWIFFRKKPVAIILGAAVALPLTILSLLLVVPAGPMLGGEFYYFLQRKRLRRGGLSQMFRGFSDQFVSLMLAFLVPFLLIIVSVVPGLLLIWGSAYRFDTYGIGSEFGGLVDGVGMVFGAFYDAMTGAKNLSEAWVKTQEAIWTSTSQLNGFFSTVGTIPGWGKLGLVAGAIACVVLPYQLTLRWMFALPMAAHYKLGYRKAMELSGKQASKDKTGVLFFIIMSVLFNSIGLVMMILGRVLTRGGTGAMVGGIFLIVLGIAMLIFTFAITGTAYCVAYEEFCGRPRKMEEIPNWIMYTCIAIGTTVAVGSVYTVFSAMLSAYE